MLSYGGKDADDCVLNKHFLAAFGDHPSYIILHCGGNDLNYTKLKK